MTFYWNIARLWQNCHFFNSCLSLGLPEDFGSIANRGRGGLLALESPIICSSIKSCMKTKGDMVCFTLNNVFLIVQKHDDCAEEKDAGLLGVFFVVVFLLFFFFFFFFYCFSFFSFLFVCVVFFLRFDLQFFPPFSSIFLLFPSSFVWYEILLNYSQSVAESALIFTFCIFLGLP